MRLLIEQMSAVINKNLIFFRGKKSTSCIAWFCLNLNENLLVVMDIKLQSYMLAHRSPNDLFQTHPSAGFFSLCSAESFSLDGFEV